MKKNYWLWLSFGLNVLLVAFTLHQFWLNRETYIQYHITSKPAKILMLGDSQIENGNWSFLLHRLDVARVGLGGKTTEQILVAAPDAIRYYKPNLCLIQCGTNDLTLPSYSPERTLSFYVAIIDLLQKNGVKPVAQTIAYQLDSPKNAKIDTLNLLIKTLCMRNKIDLIDLNKTLSNHHNLRADCQKDGIHFNSLGYELWATSINTYLTAHND